jgi:hypothetical protein
MEQKRIYKSFRFDFFNQQKILKKFFGGMRMKKSHGEENHFSYRRQISRTKKGVPCCEFFIRHPSMTRSKYFAVVRQIMISFR